jgi:hypothetical protein
MKENTLAMLTKYELEFKMVTHKTTSCKLIMK